MKKILLCLALVLLSTSAHAALNVFACEPEWAALTQLLAGDKASIYTATGALQDPHRVEARPSLIARARRTNLLVCTGAELEMAWLPVILRESGNSSIAPGTPGNFEAARFVRMLEIPTHLDRSEGDVHAAGNPHIQTDPRNFLAVADALTKRLIQLDSANTVYYQQQLATFNLQWRAAIARWEKQAAPLNGVAILAQHRGFPYLNSWLGLKQVAELEPKPGMEPSAAYLGQVLNELQRHPAKMVLRAAYQEGRPSDWIAERAHIRAVSLPYTVGGSDKATDLYTLFDDTIARLLAGLK
ncbi:metal ABC transporter substrate-binding protein [Gallionella capsiferriformans]|jgi:zinc/manganese transport system substrate-binding protein|uniref:Periplasmic solute binding protein n=1 Tax=Gallionella capsiferriformans (strain ES-2) TaxID=395494 RepID=D9SI04_GALCS|nr:zinc ABC transporter substrate-binding protein [Gallionella capsiferriformans]ADL56094.1 periplasmic solute binding protein [Gallionella capsiferriformans ES-2]